MSSRKALIFALAGALGCAGIATPPPGVRRPELAPALLTRSSTAPVELTLDLAAYFGGAARTIPAELEVDGVRGALDAEPIGGSSSLICRWRKLRLRFDDGPRRARLYLSPHCQDPEIAADQLPSEAQVWAEGLANHLLGALDLPALETRLVTLRWRDAAHLDDVRTHPALVVEDVADVAVALSGDASAYQGPGRAGPVQDLSSFDPLEVARFHLFQILINNRDWRAFQLEPLGRMLIEHRSPPLHNVFALWPKGARPVLVPLDLDASSFAALPRAIAEATGGSDEQLLEALATPGLMPGGSALERWLTLRVLGFRQLHAPAISEAASADFVRRRGALESAVRGFVALAPARERAALSARAEVHLEAFFRALAARPPVLVARDARLFARPEGDAVVCSSLLVGAPLVVGEARGSRVHVAWGVRLRVGQGPATPLCPGPDGAPLEGWLEASAIGR